MSLMSLGANYLHKSLANSTSQVTAHHLKKINKAANDYVRDNFSQLTTATTDTDLTIENLIASGYLSENIPNKNNYGQKYKMKVTPITPNTRKSLQLIIVTRDGRNISENDMRYIAGIVGGHAGYVSALSPTSISGSHGGWKMSASGHLITSGHLATVDLVHSSDVVDIGGFLSRKRIDGYPEYNTMETDLKIDKDHKIYSNDTSKRVSLSMQELGFFNTTGTKYIKVGHTDGTPKLNLRDNKNQVDLSPTELTMESDLYKASSLRNSHCIVFTRDTISEQGSASLSSYDPSVDLWYKRANDSRVRHANLESDVLTFSSGSTSANQVPTVSLSSASGLEIQNKQMVTSKFLQVPFHVVSSVETDSEILRVANLVGCNHGNPGRLFSVGSATIGVQRLYMCKAARTRASSGRSNYVRVSIIS